MQLWIEILTVLQLSGILPWISPQNQVSYLTWCALAFHWSTWCFLYDSKPLSWHQKSSKGSVPGMSHVPGSVQALLPLPEDVPLLLLWSLLRLLSLLLLLHPFLSPHFLFSVSSLLLSLLVNVWKEVWLPGICCYSFLQTCLRNPGINCMLSHL